MTEIIFQVEDAPEGGCTARAIGAAIFAEADTPVELPEVVRDAVGCHFDPGQAPTLVRLHYRLHHTHEVIVAP
jgi:hypothetical protein